MSDGISASAAGQVKIGDITVNRLGLGTNRITDIEPARALLRRALELDINFIDTAFRYQGGASETTIGNALAPFPKGLVVATKGGWDNDRPEYLRDFLEESLRRLHADHIDLYQLHRVNPDVPLEQTMYELKKFQDEGKVRHIGLSEVTIEQLEQAQKVVPIVSVQNQYNIIEREHEQLVNYCTEHNIVFIPWFPLGGLAGGAGAVAAKLNNIAKRCNVTPQQIALAWLLKRSPMMLPIPGTLSIAHLEDNVRSANINLTNEDYKQLN